MKRLLALALLCLPICAATTTITDTIRVYDGALFTGKITITAPLMTTAAGDTIAGWQRTYTITAGAFSAALEPNDTATPAGTSYLVRYLPNQGSALMEYWVVTTSATPLKIGAVRVSSVPTPALTIALSQLSTSGAVKGDLLAFGTSWGSQAVGTNGYVLTADSTQTRGIKWAAAVGGVTSVFGRTGAVVAVAGDYSGLYEVPLTFSLPLSRSVNTISCPTCGTATVSGGIKFPIRGTVTAGTTVCDAAPFAFIPTGWVISTVGDAAASIQYDIWMIPYSTTALPTIANSIVAAAPPIVSGARASKSTAVSTWTTPIPAEAIICFTVTSATTTATLATLTIQGTHQ